MKKDGAHFSHANTLDSTTQTTNWSGGGTQEIMFYPWGQIWQQTSGYFAHEVFAGLQDADPSLGVYQTLNRRFQPLLGRWMTPDPLGGDITNPQSLNRYAYVLNNPTTLTDPLGLAPPPGLLKAEFKFHCLMDPVCNHWMSTGGYDYWTILGYDPFDVMQIPVRSYDWVPTQFTQNGGYLYITTGHWEAIARTPDFFQYTLNVNPPNSLFGTLVGATFSYSADKYRKSYLDDYIGVGFNVGRGPFVFSASAQPGWLLGQPAAPQALRGLLTGSSWTAGTVSPWFVGGFVTTNHAGTAITLGAGTPQLGFSWIYGTTLRNLIELFSLQGP